MLSMTSQRRVRLSPEARREQLLTLGVRMLATRTLDDLSVEDLAEEAGISRGLLFHYFRNKQEFHRAVVSHATEQMVSLTEPDPSLPPLEQLSAVLEKYLDYVVSHYDVYTYLIRGHARTNEELFAIVEETRVTLANRVRDNLHLLDLPNDDITYLAIRGWLAFVEEVVVKWVPEQKVSREEVLRLFATSLPTVIAAAH
jgi:AcrR family transcriptional regulator